MLTCQRVTSQQVTGHTESNSNTLGDEIRRLREERGLRLWEVAPAASMDAALLSKIERGQRLPTAEQTAALAKYFTVEVMNWEGMRMAEKFLSDNGHNPVAAALAAIRIKEGTGEYLSKRKPRASSKATKR